MKRKLSLFLTFLGLAMVPLAAQTDLFMPANAITMGMGGAYTANAEGYNAFFYNPAGFARKGEFTLLSANVYGVLDKVIYDMLVSYLKGEDPLATLGSAGSKDAGQPRASFDASSLAAYGVTQATVDKLGNSVSTLGSYLTDVGKTSGGNQAISDSLATMAKSDPAISSALSTAGIDPSNPKLGTDTNAVLGALMPVLLNDPAKASALTTQFVTTVETKSGVAAPTATKTVGADLQTALVDVNDALAKALPSANANIGAMLGIGWVGKGLGIGLFGNVVGALYTPTNKSILSGLMRTSATVTLAGGLGFNLSDDFSIGFSLRPTLISYVSFLPASLITGMFKGGSALTQEQIIATLLSNGIYKGFRLGVDVGALWDLGDFTIGLAVKDLLPLNFLYKKYDNLNSYVQDLSNFQNSTEMATAYQVPALKVNLGLQWHPDMGKYKDVIDPLIGIDILDLGGWLRTGASDKAAALSEYNFLEHIAIGAQIKFFKFIALRGGYGQGMFDVGLGLNLYVVDINVAVGAKYKDRPKSLSDYSDVGFSLEVAILRL